MTDPWLAPGAPRPTGVLPPAQPYPQPYAQPYAQPQHPYAQPPAAGSGFPPAPQHAPASGSGRGIAITALVVAVVALLGVIGVGLMSVGSGFAQGLGESMLSGYELEGTLPQAAPGRVYTPQEVQTEVERVLDADWSTYEDLRCEELTFAEGAFTSCTGIVDDLETEVELDVVDDAGHFTLTQYW